MTYPTREQLEEYIRNNKLDTDESYPRSDWWKFKQQRDEYKQQRDELIKDIAKLRERNVALEYENKALRLQATSYFDKWAESMGKANAFEKVERCMAWFEENDRYEFEGQILEIQKIINELERDE
ncbi:hypothetical protein H3984_11645 [Staphylococcus warneri]|uniref:hypothetical protein n=1 Tax=Staphylococcus warneri TaxID=1292 RepID=UPI00118CE9E1|nr:hypothetical protein [Staphylococcus warneri]MBF2179199.1 hypothetical protein [Staphylococcus warneri]MBF2181590.1 hypothetical protein [Staphylococcus warneri]MBF2186104.1 hypothetical protein [Staphylococcus warneri]MBF2263473.1 hypothetical protein [Staphylococcus warneri]MBF2266189.1 hypothetical protein [Staphylococcus warneri]